MSALIGYFILWLVGTFAGTGIYGATAESAVYQAGGTGTFGIPNELFPWLYGIGMSILLPALKMFAPKWVPIVKKILEFIHVMDPPETNDVQQSDHREFLESFAAAYALAGKTGCPDVMKKGADFLECASVQFANKISPKNPDPVKDEKNTSDKK